MNRSEILEGLKEILSKVKPKIDTSTVSEQSILSTELGIDSLSMLLMSLAIEDKFKFKFDPKGVFTSVGDVIKYIEKDIN